MSTLEDDVRIATMLGMTYGKYKAMMYKPPLCRSDKDASRTQNHSHNDSLLFRLWQSGMTDAKIAEFSGTSRSFVQRWRDSLELPSTYKNKSIDTKKYRMIETSYGIYVIKND